MRSSHAKATSGRNGMKVAIFNIGKILSGDLASPTAAGDTIVLADGKIQSVGNGGGGGDYDVEIDAGGMMAMPGLIDSHVHITFGDYTPRQKTVGFLESYIHGGVTTCISASEVHVPGRPPPPPRGGGRPPPPPPPGLPPPPARGGLGWACGPASCGRWCGACSIRC